MFGSRQIAKAVTLVGLLTLATPTTNQLYAADWAQPITGNLLGTVVDTAGVPQIGASVKLFNKYNRLVARTLSTSDGRFAFGGLAPDFYSLHVTLDSFVPAFRDKIAIRAGANSMLQINMATLFSSIQINSTMPVGAMSSDWKWVLRSSPATRPITRLMPDDDEETASAPPRLFSGTHMSVGIAGADSGLLDTDAAASDLETQFALSTNINGRSLLQLAGRVGQDALVAGANTFALCAIYTPSPQFGLAKQPEIALVVSQARLMPGLQGTDNGGITLRVMSLSVYQTADPMDGVHLEYGVTSETADYLQHATRVSPFARISANAGRAGTVVAAYSDGGRPDELTAHSISESAEPDNLLDDDLDQPVNALARMPQISVRNDRLELQRTQDFELGLVKKDGNRTYAVTAFDEGVSNGRINVAGDISPLGASSLLSDGVSTTSIYNIGNYNRRGFAASVDQRFDDRLSVQLAYGRMGAFSPSNSMIGDTDFLRTGTHNLASMGVRGHIPKSGTRISAHYGWSDPYALIPQHTFTTQNMTLAPGFNIMVRQPLPSFFGMPGHLELTGDLHNLFSQGYLPLNIAGHQLLLVQAPKVIRGGLSITF